MRGVYEFSDVAPTYSNRKPCLLKAADGRVNLVIVSEKNWLLKFQFIGYILNLM